MKVIKSPAAPPPVTIELTGAEALMLRDALGSMFQVTENESLIMISSRFKEFDRVLFNPLYMKLAELLSA
jgi:hypothetical protein